MSIQTEPRPAQYLAITVGAISVFFIVVFVGVYTKLQNGGVQYSGAPRAFTKDGWSLGSAEIPDGSGRYQRIDMLDDLFKTVRLIGMTKSEVVENLGYPTGADYLWDLPFGPPPHWETIKDSSQYLYPLEKVGFLATGKAANTISCKCLELNLDGSGKVVSYGVKDVQFPAK